MQPIAIESTTLASIAYHGSARLLQLQFRTGQVYHYFEVPPQIFEGLLQATSKGKYFNRDIRGRFPCTLMSGVSPNDRT